jgi:hypothetical protein
VKILLRFISNGLTTLALWVSHIGLRGLVLAVGFLLSLSASNNHLFSGLDTLVLRTSSYFFSSPLGASGIGIVDVPKEELATWESDIHSSGKLAALLSNLLSAKNTKVGLVLQQPIDTGTGTVDAFVEKFSLQKVKVSKEARTLLDRKFLLMDLLKNDRVVIGVERVLFSGQKPLLLEPSVISSLPSWLQTLLWPVCYGCFSVENGFSVARPQLDQYTIVSPLQREYWHQLIFTSSNNEFFNGFLLQLLKLTNNIDSQTNLVWRKEFGVMMGGTNIPLSVNGRLIPVHGLSQRMSLLISHISLEEALARSAFPKIVIIAQKGSDTAKNIATALYSIERGNVLSSPWWQSGVLALITLLTTLYLCFLLTNISIRKAAVVTAVVFLTLLITQIILAVSKGLWLPVAMQLVWLLLGHFLLMVWMIKRRRVETLISRADNICIAHARTLIEQEELGGAREYLLDCSNREPLLNALYDISEAYSRKKDYLNALDVLIEIKHKDKNFKDTAQKLNVLQSMIKSMLDPKKKESFEKTVTIKPEKNIPQTFGRYRI